MAEIRQQFRSFDEWQDWRPELGSVDSVRASILDAVRARGFTEPMTGLRRPPFQIAIRERGLQESIACCGLNARARGLLAQLEMELRSRQLFSTGLLKLLGTDARSRLGSVLRGIFPNHVAAEFNLPADDGGVHITVPLTAPGGIIFAAATFDVFVTGERFTSSIDFNRALPEIMRLLKPGGLIVGYLPFVATAGDQPSAGWEILNKLRDAGCSDAYLTTIASSFFGIASEDKPGPLILTAQKSGAARLQSLPPPNVMEPGELPDKLCVMLALPRSGTTLLTSMFAVHSQAVASYEPWNSKLLDIATSDQPRIATLLAKENIRDAGGKTLFVKETAVDTEYIRAMRGLYEGAPYPVERHSILLLRDLEHTVLSEIDRRNEWWNDDVTLSRDFIATWVRNRGATLWQIIAFARSANSLVIAFEELAAHPERLMRQLADRLGFHFEPQQLEYEKHMRGLKPKGDLNVSRNPEKINLGLATMRQDRVAALHAMIAETAAAPWFEACRALHAHVIACGGIVAIAEVPQDMLDALRATGTGG